MLPPSVPNSFSPGISQLSGLQASQFWQFGNLAIGRWAQLGSARVARQSIGYLEFCKRWILYNPKIWISKTNKRQNILAENLVQTAHLKVVSFGQIARMLYFRSSVWWEGAWEGAWSRWLRTKHATVWHKTWGLQGQAKFYICIPEGKSDVIGNWIQIDRMLQNLPWTYL